MKRSTLSVVKQTILDENMCLIAERSIAELIKFQFQKKEARVFFHIAKEPMWSLSGDYSDYLVIILKAGSILAPKFVEKTVRMTETGIMEKLYRQHMPLPVKQEEDKGLEKLKLDSLGLGFIFWGMGMFAALIAFIAGHIKKMYMLKFTVLDAGTAPPQSSGERGSPAAWACQR